MKSPLKIAAFGALNGDSYAMFSECVHYALPDAVVTCAGPYPNAEAVSVPGRPLRADALKDPALREELFSAVAADARALGDDFDVYCMPCMSMIGFHDGIEKHLGKPIVRLSDALITFYENVSRLGVIHMRPATQRVRDMFGDRAVTPNHAQAERLLAAEGNTAQVEALMEEIIQSFRDQGLTHVLLARADAPKAIKGPASRVSGLQTNSYFDILAGYIAQHG